LLCIPAPAVRASPQKLLLKKHRTGKTRGFDGSPSFAVGKITPVPQQQARFNTKNTKNHEGSRRMGVEPSGAGLTSRQRCNQVLDFFFGVSLDLPIDQNGNVVVFELPRHEEQPTLAWV
jgi:hypothetical protein